MKLPIEMRLRFGRVGEKMCATTCNFWLDEYFLDWSKPKFQKIHEEFLQKLKNYDKHDARKIFRESVTQVP